MASPRNFLYDGFFSLEGGMDAGRPASTLDQIQVHRAVNATFRGGYPRPRLGTKRLPLVFDDESVGKPNIASILPKAVGGTNLGNGTYSYQVVATDSAGRRGVGLIQSYSQMDSTNTTPEITWAAVTDAVSYKLYRSSTAGIFTENSLVATIPAPTVFYVDQVQTLGSGVPTTDIAGAFNTARFQGAGSYVSLNNTASIFLSLGGQIYKVPITTTTGTHVVTNETSISGINPANSPTLTKAWFCQAEQFLIVQDNQSRPLIYDGATFRRAADDEVPTGGPMAYGIGRLWVARGREYFGGDLVWSDLNLETASILKFTENDYLNEGGSFVVPWQTGVITGLSFGAQPDTATGEGSLLIFARSGIFEFAAPVDRAVWKAMEQPLQRFSLLNFGATSHESIIQVNGDLFFRAEDGVRSFYFARRDFTTWGNTPQSREVEPVMARDDQGLLFWASAITFNNRAMATAEPVWTDTGVEHRRLVAIDFDLISGIRGKVPPAWDGEWTPNPRILQLVSVQLDTGRRAFMIARDDDGMLGIWEFLPKETGDDEDAPFWTLETKSYQFQSPLDRKRLTTTELWIDDVQGAYNIDVFWRADNKGCWVPWARFQGFGSGCLVTPTPGDNGNGCAPPRMPVAQSRNRIALPIAPDRMDNTNCEPYRDGYEFQLRLECTGHFTIKKARLVAELLSQEVYGRISDDCQPLPADCQVCV